MKMHNSNPWISRIVTATLLALPALATAQEAAAAEAEPKTLWDKFQIGGPFMWVILLMSIMLIGLVVYNSIQLSKARWVPDDLKAGLTDHMANCRVRSAIELASGSPSFIGRMVAFAMPKIDATNPENLGRDAVEDSMAEFIANETRDPVTWVNYCNTIMQAAPMLGLLGTVSGMVGAFATLETTKGADPALLAGDISEALYTTLFGLCVAIPALFSYAFFKNLFNKRVAEATETGKELLDASIAAVQGEQVFAKVPEGLHAE
jgi:biopolymer transport protein ExbB